MKNRRVKKSKFNIKKIILGVLIVLLLVLGLIILMGNGKTSSYIETSYKTIYVSSGDTLWEIARIEAANNNYYANSDIRHIVKDIKEINDLDSSSLYAGQELVIPSL